MSHPADEHRFACEKLAELTDREVERVASGRFARDADPALVAAIRAELARRGLKVRPAADSALPRPEDEIARVERGQRIRAERF